MSHVLVATRRDDCVLSWWDFSSDELFLDFVSVAESEIKHKKYSGSPAGFGKIVRSVIVVLVPVYC